MGKNDAKSDAKKAFRKRMEMLERERQTRRKQAMLDEEGNPKDVMQALAPFAKFDRNGLDLEIAFAAPGHSSWTPELAHWLFETTKTNMEALYNAAPDWGWKDAKKKFELNDADARYLIARQKSDSKPVAFINFRFEMEGIFDVAYVYELQLTADVQRKGLGKHLMQCCELIARKNAMQWVMLTVLKNNTPAFDFYMNKMKYEIDMTSPSLNDMDAGHEILSKVVNKEAVAAIEELVASGV